ncbi:hypothetical protein F183_A44360 [Bryobacterales bacterium F-183]|nr:hypothetical protein F183_A44360 [Bryobacterales bacterium F-183]
MPLMPGARLGPYEIIALLGAGGMGEVYRANDPRLQRQVAVKVLSVAVANDSTIRQRFEIEARAASGINHPNIVRVFDFGNQDGTLYIVWELVEGKPLSDEPMTLDKALRLGAQIADGIAAAHEAAIVHRDLKPDNILVTADGRAKILDFGLAKRTGHQNLSGYSDTAMSATRTTPGLIMGTVGYMSPEQVRGHEVDHRTDIFSFGLVLYEMLAGRKAYFGDNTLAVLHAIVSQEPPELPATVPLAVKQVVARCLEKDPAHRFQSTRDLVFALRSLAGLNTRGSGGTLSSSAFAAPPKRAKIMPFIAVALALAAVGAFFGGRYLGAASAAAAQTAIDFRQLTFNRGFVSGARYAPNKTIVYSAAWSGGPIEMFSTQEDNPDSNKLGKIEGHVFAISKNNEIAIALEPRFELTHQIGTLARLQAGSGAQPQTVKANVSEADWDPNGSNLAIVTVSGNTRRLEYPPGQLLYETAGWIRDIRFSPDGQKIAFFDHQHAVLHGGAVAIVDVKDKAKKILVDMRPALEGLAWTPDGKEIWFASARAGEANRIEAVDVEGKVRTVLATPAGMRLQDIAADGSVLITRLADYSEMIGVSGTNTSQLSWLNASSPRQISADGKRILFTELSQATGPRRAAAIRDISSTSVVQRLGEGDALDISQDGSKALAILHGNPTQFVVYSVSNGQATKIPTSVSYPNSAQFHPDGQSIIFEGAPAGKFDSLWQQGISNAQARSFSPEGVSMTGHAVSPDGEYVCATAPDGKLTLYPIHGSAVRAIPGTSSRDRFVQWHKEGKAIYAYDPHEVPLHMSLIEVSTGNRTMAGEFVPNDTTGVKYIEAVLSSDATTAVYGLTHFLSTLQTVKGLK